MTLNRWRAAWLLALAACAMVGAKGCPEGTAVKTADKLSLGFSESGALKQVAVDGTSLLPPGLQDFHPVSVCDVTKGADFIPLQATPMPEEGGAIVQERDIESLSLHATARYEATDDLVKVVLKVRDASGADRGLYVRFALPIPAEGWMWWDDMESARKIGKSGTYENSKSIREFAELPEWKDKPALKMGYHSVNFCNAITGSVGLCYAVPLDQPRIFRTGYDADKGLFYIVYDVALAKETQPPGAAEFTFFLYRCDPAWGMRSALDRYYRLFPQFFTKHVKREGMWMAFSRLSDIDNVNEFRFAFQEGAPEPGYDDKLGVASLTYFTHAGMFADIPGYNPETDPEPTYDRMLAAMREQFKKNTGSAEIFDSSGLHDAEGRLSIVRASVYGHIISQYNLDPGVPYGRYMLDRIPSVFQEYREKRGGELDGFYYDGITTGINYRREHFAHAGYPPLWDAARKKPLLFNYFSSVEFAAEAAKRLHEMGKITMMNGAMGESFYTAPYLDVMGAETGLRIGRPDFNYVRTICYQKPFVTLLKGNFSKLTQDDFVLFMRRCVAYGVFPGYFDWPPSGLGPGSQYWEHGEWYERDRLNHRKYQALAAQLAAAGWAPLTLARSSDPAATVERFGSAEKGEVFYAILNDSRSPIETTISIPSAGAPEDCVVVDEVAEQRPAAVTEAGGLKVALSLQPEALAALHLVSKERLALCHAEEILKALDLRKQMAAIDQDRPQYLVHWRPTRTGPYERDTVDGRTCMKLSNATEAETKSASQWVMLYQERPDPLRLRVKMKCKGIQPGKNGKLIIDALLCHVNMKTHFTERKRESYPLETGDCDWREKEIIITPERPLRSIQLSVSLQKAPGAAWFDEISITPVGKPEQEYVVDPKMEQWYERPDPEVAKQVETRCAEIEEAVRKIKESKGSDLLTACASAMGKIKALEKWIADGKRENPCRRALRECGEASRRLALVCSTLMGISGPQVIAPESAVPGEEIPVEVRAPGVGEGQVDYTIEPPQGWRVQAAGGGRFKVTVPAGGPGAMGRIEATAVVRPSSGVELALKASAEVKVVAAVEAAMRLEDVSLSGDRFQFAVEVANNDRAGSSISLKADLPQGWKAEGAPGAIEVAAKSRETMRFCAVAPAGAAPGRYEVRAQVSCAKLSTPIPAFSETVFFLPGTLNLLKDPGFEKEGAPDWAKNEQGFQVDGSQAHSGRQSIRLANDTATGSSGASQTVTVNQKMPCPIVVRGHAKAEKVSGGADKGFSLYVDVYHTDGTPLYGQAMEWQTGTTDWQYGELTIEPAKPVRNVNVYCLLRRHSGTAWFDDIVAVEDPTRGGNLARQAKVSVDSCFANYTPSPINDGVTRTHDIHWAEESWASAESSGPHWVELAFDKPVAMKRMLVYWSMDHGVAQTSQAIEAQAWRDGGWQKIGERTMPKSEPVSAVDLGQGVTAQRVRVFQPAGRGPSDRPGLMWVREIEIYEK